MNVRKQFLRMGLLGALSLSAFLGFAGNVFAATNHALIVGVSQYENLPEELWLKGPKNDAVLVRDFLIANETRPFESANITVLADGVDGAETATLAEIRTALKDIAVIAETGDFVYLDPPYPVLSKTAHFTSYTIGIWVCMSRNNYIIRIFNSKFEIIKDFHIGLLGPSCFKPEQIDKITRAKVIILDFNSLFCIQILS